MGSASHHASSEGCGRRGSRDVLRVRGGFSGRGAPVVEPHPVIQPLSRTLSDKDCVQSTVSAPALFLRRNKPYLPAEDAQLARDWGSFAGAVRGHALLKCRDGWTPGSDHARPPHLILPGEQGFAVPRVLPALVPDSGPNKRVCFVLYPPSGRQSNTNPNPPVTGHWAVRDLVARPIGEPLAPIPEVNKPLETIKEMEIEDTSPEDYFALPQPVVLFGRTSSPG